MLSESYRKYLKEWSDDPAADYDRYCDDCDREYAEWADEEMRRLEDSLEDEDAVKDWLDWNCDSDWCFKRFEELHDTSNLSDDEYNEKFEKWINEEAYEDDVVLKHYEDYVQEQIDEINDQINDNYRVYHSDQDDHDRWLAAQED